MNILVTDNKKRHGNCVPFILINDKTKTITYKGSLKEIAGKLKISQGQASMLHRNKRKHKKGAATYTIKRVGFSQQVEFC